MFDNPCLWIILYCLVIVILAIEVFKFLDEKVLTKNVSHARDFVALAFVFIVSSSVLVLIGTVLYMVFSIGYPH